MATSAALTNPPTTSPESAVPPSYRMNDPLSASYRLYSLIDTHDRTLDQVRALDTYILTITEKIVKDATNSGHVGHGLLLLTRKCVAEGMRDVFVQLASRKWIEVQQCYNYILQHFNARDDRFGNLVDDVVEDHEVVNIARGLTMECCAFQRGC